MDGIELSIRRLTVRQSIFELARGVTPMDAIVLNGSKLSLDSRAIKGDDSFSLSDIDFSGVTLPAEKIELDDFELSLFDEDGEVKVVIDDGVLVEADGKFNLSGSTTFLDGPLSISGNVAKASGDLGFEFEGSQLHLVDQQWQKWPGIGPAVLKHLGADSVFDLSGAVTGNLKTGIKYFADIETKDARLYIPKFELPIAIRKAEVRIEDGLVTYKSVVAAMGDVDVVNGTGTTTIDGLPCRSKFTGDFTDVNVADLRKLVKEIPAKVVGTATGKVIGSVDVNEDLETTLRIDANGDTSEASYGQINAATGNVDVQIQPLVLTQNGKTIDLQGSVTVTATTKKQDVDGVLATFDLEALDRQFEFEMLGDGHVDLVIPLNSAADLRTWKLKVDSVAQSGSVGGMRLQDLRLTSSLDNGQLVFHPTTAFLADAPSASVDVTVRWPLPNRAVDSISKTGTVQVNGKGVPPREAIAFFARQMKNAEVDYKFRSQVESMATSDLTGSLGFNSTIVLPAGIERPVDSWDVEASLFDSVLTLPDSKVENFRSGMTIKNGVLEVKGLEGQIAGGGGIQAGASLNLATSKTNDVYLNAIRFPATWLARTIFKLDSSGEFVRRTGLNPENVSEKLGGVFDATIKMPPDQEDQVLWEADSKQIVIFGKKFTDVEAAGNYENEFSIEKLKANLPGGGQASMDGDWIAGSDDGAFDLRWKDAWLVELLENQFSLPSSFSSLSDGELAVSFENSQPIFCGTFDLIEPKVFGGTFADHRFAIETVNGRIEFEEVGSKRQNGIVLDGSFAMRKPFDFDLSGKTRAMPLSTASYDQLSGFITSNFELSGEASTWKLESAGSAKIESLSLERTELSDFNSKWDFDSTTQTQQLSIDGLGGKIELDSIASGSDDLVFNLGELELAEFAVFRKLPVNLAGAVSGTATIRNWRSPEKRSITASGTGNSIMVGQVRLTGVEGNASLTDGGQELKYSLDSQLLDGKLEINGETKLASAFNPFRSTFPVKVRLSNARMRRFAESVSRSPLKALRQLQGRISLAMDWEVTPGEYPAGSGKVSLEDAKWRNRLVSRRIYSDIALNDGVVQLKNIHADLQHGEVAGRATIPLVGSASGSYELDVRKLSLKRLIEVLLDDPIKANGQVSVRLSGRTGKTITGSGTLGVSRAGLFGVANQSMKLPMRFRVQPQQRTARIEMPRNRFRAFQGNVNGSVSLDIGSRIRLDSKLELSNIDSHEMLHSLTGYTNAGNGKLSGRLELSGKNLRSVDDLTGSFRGNLKQSNALAFPLLDQVSRFLGNSASLRNDQFGSDSIDLALSKGRINVRQFRLQNALTSIAVSGNAWLDGRLDMEVAARVERLDQPALIDQLAGSQIAGFAGPQAAFFAQAAEFLSERIVFLDVGGTAQRPNLRLNPGKQLKEEAIRYFLRGSQILPNANGRNN
jgi:hypothetical protein